MNSTTASSSERATESPIWPNLRRAIAHSSGFQRWQREHQLNRAANAASLDEQVRSYLRETLATLAY
ncbi:MAG: hypothetical protein HC838_09090 [Spirulinaceae cyanobacterium RM2_2_10]|nr:hypothetical protein [Spirulinaceae cyanobacterium SM2_1_0]NJO20173.1 hypothetical protein [Spirulinaceae cyanobacterium RM2_2_10]